MQEVMEHQGFEIGPSVTFRSSHRGFSSYSMPEGWAMVDNRSHGSEVEFYFINEDDFPMYRLNGRWNGAHETWVELYKCYDVNDRFWPHMFDKDGSKTNSVSAFMDFSLSYLFGTHSGPFFGTHLAEKHHQFWIDCNSSAPFIGKEGEPYMEEAEYSGLNLLTTAIETVEKIESGTIPRIGKTKRNKVFSREDSLSFLKKDKEREKVCGNLNERKCQFCQEDTDCHDLFDLRDSSHYVCDVSTSKCVEGEVKSDE